MSLRPIDLQVNFLRETDARVQRVKEGMHEAGAQRYATDLERERALAAETVRDIARSGLDAIDEKERKRREEEAERKKREGKRGDPPGGSLAGPPRGTTAEPTKGSIIDIRFE